jgi:hypothetical protein
MPGDTDIQASRGQGDRCGTADSRIGSGDDGMVWRKCHDRPLPSNGLLNTVSYARASGMPMVPRSEAGRDDRHVTVPA